MPNIKPIFTEMISIKSKSGKIGMLLDYHGAQPTYNNEINQWIYPWSYNMSSEGFIPENYIDQYMDKNTGKWKSVNTWYSIDMTASG